LKNPNLPLQIVLRYGDSLISEELKKQRNELAIKVLKELPGRYETSRIAIRGCKGTLGSNKSHKNHVSTEVGKWMQRLSDESSISHDILSNWETIFQHPHSTFRHLTTCLSHYLSVEDQGQSIIGGWSVNPSNPGGAETNSSNCYDGKHQKANSPISMRDWSKTINFFLMGN